ncbi:probable L-type lectin-domain containing receptor kinase S.5 [Juglans microcarpa x Juglans regia]|uniref:probable L-type lectin-domain containing receptor kinase S.5 n=1 Tax=Juglans microcarpa x Juglans regia TaxID=2249226 RepID=UPI001B7DDC55|nr:probable L-type lectin-domain containing receptor kinase S.5 [Juglans microcarpa x Juglans regia]
MGIISNGSSIALAIILFSLLHLSADIQTAALMVEKNKFSFDEGFNQTANGDYFVSEGKAGIGLGALQITPDTANDAYSLFNSSGRIMFIRPFRLWSDDSQASFNSTFVINIYRKENWTAGQGLAFLIAPNTSMPASSQREWLGLTNEDTDGNNANQIVAIEFDTQKQVYDPDDNHIGLDINSVKSNTSVSLNDHGIRLSPEKATNYSVWVDYNGTSKLMKVYMVKEGEPKPRIPLLNATINLKEYVKEESYFGFAASTGYPNIQLNCVLKWSLWVEDLPEKRDLTWLKIGAGVGVPAVILLILLGVIYANKRKRSSAVEESNVFDEHMKSLPGMPREFKYRDIKKATNNFHESMKLGEGGFGIVYRGILNVKDHINTHVTEIAVKQFVRDNIKSKDDFLAELTIIHRLRHRHLVRLVGWCYDEGKLLLLYDFMPNGSLDKHLYDASNRNTLNWERRYRILAGVASALHYLHNDYDQKVVHRDIKASNILLDSDYNARLGDFGLARALDNDRNSYAELGLGGVAGTMGYVAPECFHTGRATPESDVFGFGAVVLEVVCGRSPGIPINYHQHKDCSLVDWVWMFHREGSIQEAVDERLNKYYVVDEAKRLLLLGLACSHPVASERPRTQAIYQIIAGAMPPPHVPPCKPVFTWPLMGAPYSNTESTTSTVTVSSKVWSVTNVESNIQMSSGTSQSFKSLSTCSQ